MVAVTIAVAMLAVMALPGFSVAKPRGSGVGVQSVITVPADSWESDDSTATAKVLPGKSSHTLDAYEDEDWMKFSVTATDTPYVFETQITGGNDDFDLYMYLYKLEADGTLTEIDSEDDHDYWNAYSEFMSVTLDPGEYRLLVTGYDDDEQTGMYDLFWAKGYARRIYGVDRYDTAVEASKLMWQQTSVSYDWDFDIEGIVIASGLSAADGVAGSLLASAIDSPLLLAGAGGLSSGTIAEIERALRPEVYYSGDDLTIYILGGTTAVPAVVESQLKASPVIAAGIKTGMLTIKRLAGADRYKTAALIAEEADAIASVSSKAFIVNGTAWPDALSVAAPAVYGGHAILPVKTDAVPQATLDALSDLGITEVVIVGGTSVVSTGVEGSLTTLLGAGNVSRIGGMNRYETSLLVAEHAVDEEYMDDDHFILVSGENYPDALAAGPMAYMYNYGYGVQGPILLTPKAALSKYVKDFMDEYGAPEELCYVIGGPGAISDAAVGALNAYRPAMLPTD
jgi:putative cell wall-binding protein